MRENPFWYVMSNTIKNEKTIRSKDVGVKLSKKGLASCPPRKFD